MKLLFDENLSPKLARILSDLFPDSVHVRDVGLNRSDDASVWKYAQDNTNEASFMAIHPKSYGCHEAIVRRLMWKGYYEYIFTQ